MSNLFEFHLGIRLLADVVIEHVGEHLPLLPGLQDDLCGKVLDLLQSSVDEHRRDF